MRVEVLVPLVSYLLGSIPFGYLLVRLGEGVDIRSIGSGNIGATNVFRKSRWAGLLTLVLDGAKGYAAVIIARAGGADVTWQAVAALAAIAGHVFSLFLSFRGGKGVAAAAGAYLALAPRPLAASAALFLATVVATRYISLASIVGTAAFPVLAYLTGEPAALVALSGAGSALIVVKHHANIRRLFAGTENKFALGRRA